MCHLIRKTLILQKGRHVNFVDLLFIFVETFSLVGNKISRENHFDSLILILYNIFCPKKPLCTVAVHYI